MARDARRHRRAHPLSAALGALLALACLIAPAAAQARPVDFAVSFGDGARLGASTSMSIRVGVDPRLPPVTEFRVLTPAGIDLSASGLGAASCRRPAAVVSAVMNQVLQRPCPANSLMGTGAADAGLLLDPDDPLYGAATLELHAGAPVQDKPGLVVVANTYNPARFQLTYEGYLYIPPPRFGVGLAIRIPPIPDPPFGAAIALAHMRLVVGAPGITYTRRVRGRPVAYHPSGIPLPRRCAPGSLRFRVILRFADGSRHAADDVVRCPVR